jgi:putative hydrolase of the HAD superfamily
VRIAPERFPFAGRVRAVLFDAGNTLLWLDHERMARVATDAGLPVDFRTMRTAEMRARPVLDPYLRTASKREGHDTSRRYAEAIVAQLAADPSARARAADALLAVWGSLWIVPPPDASAVLDALAARGVRVGCVSNSSGGVSALLERAGLLSRLGCVVDSGLVGVEKPDARIFRIGCERLGTRPGHTVYVGDFYSLDFAGARSAGLEGVLLDPLGVWASTDATRVGSLTELLDRL